MKDVSADDATTLRVELGNQTLAARMTSEDPGGPALGTSPAKERVYLLV
jgi:hypothetical protein